MPSYPVELSIFQNNGNKINDQRLFEGNTSVQSIGSTFLKDETFNTANITHTSGFNTPLIPKLLVQGQNPSFDSNFPQID